VAEFTGITDMPGLLATRCQASATDRHHLLRDTLTALAAYERGDLQQVAQWLADILPKARQIGADDALIISHVLMARLALLGGERDTWLRYLLELERFGQQSGSLRVQCSAWLERTRVATLNNHLDVAQQALQTAENISHQEPSNPLQPANEIDNPLIARQRLRIAQGNHGVAVDELLVAIQSARLNQHRHFEIKLHLLLAMAQDGLNHTRLAIQALDHALYLAGDEGGMQGFIDEGEPLAALLRRWVGYQCKHPDQAINRNFITRLLLRIGIDLVPGDTQSNENDLSTTLTERELQVLHLLAVGHRNRAIAQKLFLSECTVKTHLHRINVKLGARSRTQAVAIARTRGWLS
jgi:LuxR family maltose regulon positive regulatory protein